MRLGWQKQAAFEDSIRNYRRKFYMVDRYSAHTVQCSWPASSQEGSCKHYHVAWAKATIDSLNVADERKKIAAYITRRDEFYREHRGWIFIRFAEVSVHLPQRIWSRFSLCGEDDGDLVVPDGKEISTVFADGVCTCVAASFSSAVSYAIRKSRNSTWMNKQPALPAYSSFDEDETHREFPKTTVRSEPEPGPTYQDSSLS